MWRIDLFDSDHCIWGVITSDPDGLAGDSMRDVKDYYKELCPDTSFSRDEFIELYADYSKDKKTLWYNHIIEIMRREFESYRDGKPSHRNGVVYDSRPKKDYISCYTQTDLYMIGYVLNRGFVNYFNPEWEDL